jgi:glycine/D-amino acid oxidase-like deaminating enzyme
MKVARLPVDPGPAAWNRLLPDPEPAQPLEGSVTADWLVIGAGFAGLAAARRLSQLDPSARIVVLEARRLADGPAGRNSGFMIDLPHDLASDGYAGGIAADQAQTAANRHAIGFAADMARAYGLSTEAFVQSGKINGAATDKGHRHNLDYAAHLAAMGEPHDMYDAARMRAITGTDYYQSGLFTPGCAMIQPALFVRSVAAGLRSNQVTIHEDSPVTSLARAGDWVAVTPKGRVTAPRVILAVNGHLASFGYLADRLMHVFTYASMTRVLTQAEIGRLGGQAIWGLTSADPMGTTVRRIDGTGGARIIIRNRFTYDPAMQVSEARIADVGRDHDRAFAARFPMLPDVAMAYRWGGRLCLSRNNVQVIGEVDSGLFAACCQNGLGTTKGTLAGLAAAELAADQPGAVAVALSQAAAPRHMPQGTLPKLAANAWLRWQELRAAREL